MTNEEIGQENRQQQPLDPETPTTGSETPTDQAIKQFQEIKQALIGTEPEWLLPEVNPKALASKP